MPVRVRVKIKSLRGFKVGETVGTSFLLNTGYIGASSEIIIPVKLAENLGLWPPPNDIGRINI
ncbi:MAG: hypothetical protein LZ173_07250 [Thaumarchaeota archaeon]|nr:hypothetical protein [Candidatus Geocrenenecus arthurdayi]